MGARGEGSLPGVRVWGTALSSGLLSLIAALLSLRITPASVRLPFGRSDAVAMYQATHTMIRYGWFTWNPDIGYPYGMDAAHIPSPEIHQWLLLKIVTLFTSDPILALNAFYLVGFFVVGAMLLPAVPANSPP